MTFLKTKTDKIFVPTVIQNCPLNPNGEMMIIMRYTKRIEKYAIDLETARDETRLAK